MVKLHVLLVSSLILNTSMAVGCASGFVEPASARPAKRTNTSVTRRYSTVREPWTFGQPPNTEGSSTVCLGDGRGLGSDATLSRLCPTSFGAGPGGRSACRRVPAAVAVMS
jgi:hypothetical protein